MSLIYLSQQSGVIWLANGQEGLSHKVHGGAIANNTNIHTQDEKVINRLKQNRSEKEQIARYAASLIVDNDLFI